jgi:hypothetical protein
MATTDDKSFITNQSIFTKYQTAADICNHAMEAVIAGCVDGAKVIDLCKLGDNIIEEEAKKVYITKETLKKVLLSQLVFHQIVLFVMFPHLKVNQIVKLH